MPEVRELPLDEISKYETRIPLDLIRKDEKVYLERLTKEIEKEGITESITIRVREDGSRIVWDGMHRLIVAQNLGIKNVPVKFIGPAVEEVRKAWDEANIAGREAMAKRAGIVPDVDFGYEKIVGDFFDDLPPSIQQKLELNPPAVEEVKGGNPAEIGTCYEDAWRFLIKEEEGELVHGSVLSKSRRIGHAWVELPTGYVWEPETRSYFTLEGFRTAASPIEEHRYSVEEAAIMIARVGKHGPWANEERAKWLKERSNPGTTYQVGDKVLVTIGGKDIPGWVVNTKTTKDHFIRYIVRIGPDQYYEASYGQLKRVEEKGGNPIPEELDLARTLAIIDSRPKGEIIESKLREEFGDAVINALRQGHYVVSGSAGYNPPLLVSLKGRELIQGGNPHYDVCHTIELCHHIEASSKEGALAIAIDKGEVDARINLIKDWHVKGKGGNPMSDEEIDQVATKVAAKVLEEVSPSVLDPGGRGMLLHFTEHVLVGAGLVVNEARARATPCNCFTYKDRDYCFSKGVIGMMSSTENPEQIAEYCKVGKTYEVKPGIKESFESFAEAAEEAQKEIEGIPKGERMVPWLSAMGEKLEKRGIEV